VSGLDALFAPASVALLGASGSPGKLGAAMTQALATFPGPVLKVNAGRPDPGAGVYASIADAADATGVVPDLVVSCIPAAATAGALREAAAAGARAALVCAGGFAEAGPDGEAAQRDLASVAKETGLRILGPNTSGFFVPHRELAVSFVPGAAGLAPGTVAVVAASGGVNHALSFALAESGTGVRLGVGLGNSVDVGQAEVLEYLAGDDGLRAVALHVETAADGRRLAEAVRTLSHRVPVAALVVGRADVGDFARSHTGALATAWRVTRAVLRQAGAVLVDDERDLTDAVAALSRVRLAASPDPGVGIVTAQAGPGLLLTDALRSAGVPVPPLADDTVRAIGTLLPPLTYQRNPVDTGRPSSDLPRVIEQVAADPSIAVTGVYALIEPTAVDVPAALAGGNTGDRLVAVIGGQPEEVRQARAALARAGIPCATTAAAGAVMLRAVTEDAVHRSRRSGAAGVTTAPFGIKKLSAPVDEDAAKGVLDSLGIRTPARRACADRAAAHRALDELGAPVAVKVLDAAILHKTDIGGVRLGIDSHPALDAALDELPPSQAVLLEQMAPPGPEFIAAARRDPAFGPVVVLGAGGTAAEVLGDVTFRLAPLQAAEAAAMLDDLATAALFTGARGAAAVNRDRLAHALTGLATVLSDARVREVEVNPLRVLPDGDVMALDAVLLLTH
jgi:acetyltransferase